MKLNFDKLGIFASFACAVHCAVLPLLVSTLPLLSIELVENKAVEWGMILLSFCLGVLSVYRSYRRHHHRLLPVVMFVAGFCCLLLNQLLGETWLWLLIPMAAVLMIGAHVYNMRLRRNYGGC